MTQPSSSGNMQVHIGGDVSGQVAIGNNILQIGEFHGDIVNIIPPDRRPNFIQRPRPVYMRPHAFPGLLDRTTELEMVTGALRRVEPVSIHGPDGLGKTALLRRLAYNSPQDNSPDGIIYFSARGKTVDDLLQQIFDSFYDSDRPAKPSAAQLRQLMQSVCALILLDDFELDYEQVSELINYAPQCIFVFASIERCIWGEGRCVQLAGLPTQEALILIERELGHPLASQERSIAEAFCEKLKGHPLYVIQGAALVRQGKTFAEIGDEFRESEDTFVKTILAELTDSQRHLLLLLAAARNVPISLKHLEAISRVQAIDAQLKPLLDRRLIQANSPAYNLTGSLALSLGQITDLSDWENRLLEYSVRWIKQNPPLPDITDALHLLLSMLEKADRDGRWEDVIALGRGVEKALILGKRWQTWLRVLEWILKAAQAKGDRTVQGWVLHQLGTRDLCLGDLDPARRALSQALSIREALRDKAGAAVTRHNLGLILPPAAPPRQGNPPKPRPTPKAGGAPVLKAIGGSLLVAVVAAVIFLVRYMTPNASPTPIPPTVHISATSRVLHPPIGPTSPKPKPITATPTRTRTPLLPPPPATTTAPPPPQICRQGVWYCEDFEDDIAQGFALDPGWSIQRAGSNVLDGSGHTWAQLKGRGWDDYRLTFRLRLMEGTVHLNYRRSTENGHLRYYYGFHQNWLTLTRGVREKPTMLAAIDASHSLGDWHTVAIVGWGGHLAIYVDDDLELQYFDPNPLVDGGLAFETLDNSHVQIDDIEVGAAGQEPDRSLSCKDFGKFPRVTSEENTDRPGMDYSGEEIYGSYDSLGDCQKMCVRDPRCMAYTFDTSSLQCWLKEGMPDPMKASDNLTSGIKICVDEGPLR